MQVGDETYRATLRRWRELFCIESPRPHGQGRPRTFREQVEMEALHKRLDAAERQSVIKQVTDDYDDLLSIGDLGGCEVL